MCGEKPLQRARRRLLAIALVLEGQTRSDPAEQAGMNRQTVRDCVNRYKESGPDGQVSRDIFHYEAQAKRRRA